MDRWRPAVQPIPAGDERPVERPAVVAHERGVRRDVPLQDVQQGRLVRMVGQQQLADHELVALPAAEGHQERHRAGGGAQTGGLGVEAHDRPVRVDGVRQVPQAAQVRGQPGARLDDGDGARCRATPRARPGLGRAPRPVRSTVPASDAVVRCGMPAPTVVSDDARRPGWSVADGRSGGARAGDPVAVLRRAPDGELTRRAVGGPVTACSSRRERQVPELPQQARGAGSCATTRPDAVARRPDACRAADLAIAALDEVQRGGQQLRRSARTGGWPARRHRARSPTGR